ncbi:MAG: hypothetical protein U0324_03890 [Polyangiales bacterium]
MRRSLAWVLVALACREEVAVGYVLATSADASTDTPDASPDAPDAAPDARPPTDATFPAHGPRSGLTGIGSRGVSASGDRFADGRGERVFRLAYVDDSGQLRVERRAADTLARVCELDLGAPPAADLVSAPAMAVPSETVFVAARERDGVLAYWYRAAEPREGPCGPAMAPWTRLAPPAGESFATGPGAAVVQGPGGTPITWVAGTTASGAVVIAPSTPGAVSLTFGLWERAPETPPGTRAASIPAPGYTGQDAGRVWVVLESEGGARQVAFRYQRVSTGRWFPSWDLRGVGGGRPDAAVSFLVSTGDAMRGGARMEVLFARAAYADAEGRAWAQAWDAVDGYHDWVDLGVPFEGTPYTRAAAVTFATRYGASDRRGPVALVAVPAQGPRVLAWSAVDGDVWSSRLTGWTLAPDPLR